VVKFASLRGNVSYLNVINGLLYVVDEDNRVFIYDENLKFKKGFKLKFFKNSYKNNGVKISKDARFIAIASKNSLGVWDIENKKLVDFFMFQNELLSCGFFDDEYVACGGVSGKIHLINLEIAKKVAEFRYKDYIIDIEFIDDEFFAIGSYNKAVVFFNADTMKKKERLLHIKPVKKILNKNYLISGDEISDMIKWDVLKHTSKDRVDFYKKLSDFYIDGDFLIIAGKKIMIYDLKNEVILNDNFLEFDASKIAFLKDKLILSQENRLFFVNVLDEAKDLIDFVLKNEFDKAYKLLDKNPFLLRTKAYEKLKEYEEKLIKKALILFEVDKFRAIEMLKPLLKVPTKKSYIQRLIEHYSEIIKFKNAIKNKNYILAFEIADKFEELKNTKYYKYLQELYKKAYKKAYQLAIKGDLEEAKKILAPFMYKTKLLEIEVVLKQADILKLFREKIAKRDFKGAYLLIEKYPFLKNSVEYKNLLEYANRLYNLALKFLEEEKFDKVKKIATTLLDIKEYELKAKELLEKLEIIYKFLYYVANDKNKAFELAYTYDFLRKLKSYKKLQKEFKELLKKAEKGDENSKEKIKEYKIKKRINFL